MVTNIMNKHMGIIVRKSISLILSGVLLFECYPPALALGYKDALYNSQAFKLDERIDKAYIKESTSASQYEALIYQEIGKQKAIIKPLAEKMEEYRAKGNAKYDGDFFKSSVYAGVSGINVIGELVYELKKFLLTFYAPREIMPFEEFEKQYSEYITNEAKRYMEENADNNSADVSLNEIVENIKRYYPAKTMYKEYVDIAQQEIDWYKANEYKLNEAAYQILREYVKAFGVNMSYEAGRLLLNLKINGKDVVTSDEKLQLYVYITSRIEKVDLKYAFNLSAAQSNKEDKLKAAAQTLQDIVDSMILGIFVAPKNDSAYADAVVSLIKRSTDTMAFPHILNVGFSSLLALKRYDKLELILADYTEMENKGKSFGDMLTFQFLVDSFNELLGGAYLRGTPSKNAQYTKDLGYYNAFEDIAELLAEENSEESLALLSKYGVNSRRPILPFAVGALLGKKVPVQLSDNLKEDAKKMGLDPNAYLAFRIANISMSDLTLTQENDLDVALLTAYPSIEQHLGAGAIVSQNSKEFKKNSRDIYDFASNAAMAGDVAFMVWATFDLVRLAGKAVSLAKATYLAGNIAKLAEPALRTQAVLSNMSKIRPYVSVRLAFRGFSARIKGAISGVVVGERALYVSEAIPAVRGASTANTAVAKALTTATFDVAKGGLIIDKAAAYKAAADIPNRVFDIAQTDKVLKVANASAQDIFHSKGFFNKYKDYSKILAKEVRKAFHNSNLRLRNLEAGAEFTYGMRKLFPGIKAPDMMPIKWDPIPLSASADGGVGGLELFHRASELDDPTALPVEVTLGNRRISGIKSKGITNILLTDAKKNSAFKLAFESEDILINPDFFKVLFNNDSFANFAKLTVGGAKDIKIKFLPTRTGTWAKFKNWGSNLFKGKDELLSGTGSVFIKEGTSLTRTPIKLATPKDFDGLKMVINKNNNGIALFGTDKLGRTVALKNAYSLYIPKGELPIFANYAKLGNFNNPIRITINASRNKVNTLYWLQVLSLSTASTGLAGPLGQNYPEMTNTQQALITMGLPYLTSLMSSFWAPFVRRFGSANMVKLSLGFAATSLGVSTVSGFGGWKDATIYNVDKPSFKPLLVSALFIGFSSSITRASFNTLMREMGGGGSLMRSMMFKNVGTLSMLLPPLITSIPDRIWPRYYTDTGKIDGEVSTYEGPTRYAADGTVLIERGAKLLDKDGVTPIKHNRVDWASFNPFLLAFSTLLFYRVHTAHYPTIIGKTKGYTIGQSIRPLPLIKKYEKNEKYKQFMNFFNYNVYKPGLGIWKETLKSTKVMFRKEVWPLTLAGFASLGVDAALLGKYSQIESNNYLRGTELFGLHIGVKDPLLMPVAATLLVAIPQISARYVSKPLLKKLGGDKSSLAYIKILAPSLALSVVGTGLLATEDNFGRFIVGMALVNIGFANTTQGFLILGTNKLNARKELKGFVTDWEAAYPAAHLGMALFPLAHHYLADRKVEKDPEGTSKLQALQSTMYIPIAGVGATIWGFLKGADLLKVQYLRKMGSLSKGAFLKSAKFVNLNAYRVGKLLTPIKHGAAITVPYFMLDNWNNNWNNKLFKPSFTPNIVEPTLNFKPMGVPAYNLNSINTSSTLKGN